MHAWEEGGGWVVVCCYVEAGDGRPRRRASGGEAAARSVGDESLGSSFQALLIITNHARTEDDRDETQRCTL